MTTTPRRIFLLLASSTAGISLLGPSGLASAEPAQSPADPGQPPPNKPKPEPKPAGERDYGQKLGQLPLPDAVRYLKPTPGSEVQTGGAVIIVNAPLPKVRRVLLQYHRYKSILPRLEQSRIIDKNPEYADVYLRAPILRGVAHVWGVARFWAPQPWGRGQKIHSTYVKGNLDAWRGMWSMYPCGSQHTVLRMELFLELKIPLPASMVSPELAWASDKAVTAVRDRAECRQTAKERGTE